ncbi:MAG TPA: transglutaminaseTgpA domain-containing protein [Chloroflexota bacterium]
MRLTRLRLGATRFRWMDIPVLLAAAWLLVQAPLSVTEANWVPNLDPLPRLVLAGLAAGYLIERSRMPGPIGLPLGALLGVELIAWLYAHVAIVGSLAERVDWLGGRVGSWLDSILAGGVSNDPLVFALAMAVLAWLLGLITAWLLFRDNAPWLAILFNGVALLMNLSYASTAMVGYVGWFTFAACVLLAAHQLAGRTELWRRAELRVGWRVVANVLVGTALASGGLLSVAWALPANISSPEVAAGWSRATQPWQGLEGEFDRWFAALNSSDRNARGLSFGRTLAPRGSFDLGDTPVLQVRASAPLYLRATTADRYAGQAITSTDTTTSRTEPNTDLLPQDQIPQGRGLLQAQIKILASKTGVAFAPDAPMRFSQSTEVDTHGDPNDLATVRFDSPILQNQEYTVVSAISTATLQDLRAAGEDYPDWVRRRYLQLPRTLPRRVLETARTTTSGATSAYDRASAIETYLRTNFTYSTHVATVPPDQDWVDYFLFDSKQGYCDYFATAMVVLLRADGIPARVASGFAPGEFDPGSGLSMVRENHAHSWVEAYFPRFGWITFEPSAIRALPPRVEEAPAPAPTAAPPPAAAPDTSQLTPQELDELLNIRDQTPVASARPFFTTLPGVLLVVLGAALLLGLIGAGVIAVAWRRGLTGLAEYQLPYAQLVRLGRWSGTLRPSPSDTPHELAERLGRQVPRAQPAIDTLTDAYVEGTYASRLPSHNPWPTWLAARRAIVRGLFGRRLGGWFGEDAAITPPPKGHPELLSRWGGRRRPD